MSFQPDTSVFPHGYEILDSAIGDLNLDKYADKILVLKLPDERPANYDSTVKRPLLIYLGQPDNTFKLASRNDNIVLCAQCGGVMGDPYQGIAIKNGFFSIEHYGGSSLRWTRIITFKYNLAKRTWYLHKDGGDSFHSSEPDKVTTQVKTIKDFGAIAFEEFDVYKD